MAISAYVTVGTALFTIGVLGALVRRNAIAVLMAIELMLNGVNILFAAFSKLHGVFTGQVFALFVIAIAAAEAAIGLSILISLYRFRASVTVDEFQLMKW